MSLQGDPADKRTDQLIVKNTAPHNYRESILKIAFHSAMGHICAFQHALLQQKCTFQHALLRTAAAPFNPSEWDLCKTLRVRKGLRNSLELKIPIFTTFLDPRGLSILHGINNFEILKF